MRYLLSLLLALLAFFTHAQPSGISNTKYFDIKIAGVKIGELVATRTRRDTVTSYQLESKVKVWLIVPIEMEHKIETVYHGKNLFSLSPSLLQTAARIGQPLFGKADITRHKSTPTITKIQHPSTRGSNATSPASISKSRLTFVRPLLTHSEPWHRLPK